MILIEYALKYYASTFPLEKGKSRIVEKVSELMKLNRNEECVTQFGFRMLLDLSQFIQRQIYFRGVYEEHILKQMEIFHEKFYFDFMIDVGANVGWHSLFATVKLDIPRVIAFEPDKNSFSRLKMNLKVNAVESRVSAHNLALSDTEMAIEMIRPNKSNDGGNYIEECSRGSDRGDVTKSILLDDYLSEIEVGRVGMIKIDVEGAEAKVIIGARKIFESGMIKVVLIELCDRHLQRFGYTSSEVVGLIESYGMTGFIIKNNHLIKINKEDIPEFCDAIFI